MKQNPLIASLEQEQLNKSIPAFRIGDTISVHTRIFEGDKERVQIFTGTVIARKGSGLSETISLYRISYGSAMERVFLLNSPRIAKIEVIKSGKVRKSKIYYIRGVFGKKAKIRGRVHTASTVVRGSEEAASEQQPI